MEKALEMLPPQVRATLEKLEKLMESDPAGKMRNKINGMVDGVKGKFAKV